MTVAYIGLGSNMDSPRQHIKKAIQELNELPGSKVTLTSSFYQSKPFGPQDQDDYINAVAQIETGLNALELLDHLQDIENAHGRTRELHWGPRTLDLDILMYGDDIIKDKRLTVPHNEMLNRAFVLVPLAEITSDCTIPGAGLIDNYLKKINCEDLEILE